MMIHAFLRSSAFPTALRSRSPSTPAGSAGAGFLTGGAGGRVAAVCADGAATGAAAGCAEAALVLSDCQNFRRIRTLLQDATGHRIRRRLQSIMVAAALIPRNAAPAKSTAEDARVIFC